MADKTTSYILRIDSNAAAVGREGAEGMQKLSSSITSSQQAIKDMQASLRALRGSTDEVRGAKDQLKAKIEAERASMSANNLALLKAGTSYTKLADAQKKAVEESRRHKEHTEAVERSVRAAGGPVGDLKDRIENLKTSFSTSAGATALVVGAIGALVAAAGAATAKLLELGGAAVKWIVEAADAARNAGLLRLAWTGSARDAEHLGHQIDALAAKVPIAKDKLTDMGGELVRTLRNTQVSGQGIIDTFNAVGEASSAMGDQVGKQLQDIISRAKNTGRVQIGLFELQGTGISRDDVAKKLAAQMKIGVDAARAALAQGRAPINAAAAAIRAAVEERFGEVNAKKLISLESTFQKFKDNIAGLAKDVNIEPLLKDFADLANMFNASTVPGAALKTIIKTIGDAIGGGFGKHKDELKHIFEYGEIAVIKFMVAVKTIDLQLQSVFGKDYKDKIVSWGLGNAAREMRGLGDIIERTGGEVQKTITMLRDLGDLGSQAADNIKKAFTGFEDLGTRVIDGLVGGIKAGIERVKSTVHDVAEAIKKTFTGGLKIGSPSKVFEDYGRDTTEGYEKGIEGGSRGPQRAVDRMVPDAPKGSGAAAPGRGRAAAPGGAGGPMQLTLHLHVGSDVQAKQLSEPHFLQQLTKALGDALSNAGLPVQSEPTS